MSQSNAMESPLIPVSWGDLIDKITILEIKAAQIESPDALKNVRQELDALGPKLESALSVNPNVLELKDKLKEINQKIWDVEDAIRLKESAEEFGSEFIELARAVYKTNDLRASIKRRINLLMNSRLIEEKSYQPY